MPCDREGLDKAMAKLPASQFIWGTLQNPLRSTCDKFISGQFGQAKKTPRCPVIASPKLNGLGGLGKLTCLFDRTVIPKTPIGANLCMESSDKSVHYSHYVNAHDYMRLLNALAPPPHNMPGTAQQTIQFDDVCSMVGSNFTRLAHRYRASKHEASLATKHEIEDLLHCKIEDLLDSDNPHQGWKTPWKFACDFRILHNERRARAPPQPELAQTESPAAMMALGLEHKATVSKHTYAPDADVFHSLQPINGSVFVSVYKMVFSNGTATLQMRYFSDDFTPLGPARDLGPGSDPRAFLYNGTPHVNSWVPKSGDWSHFVINLVTLVKSSLDSCPGPSGGDKRGKNWSPLVLEEEGATPRYLIATSLHPQATFVEYNFKTTECTVPAQLRSIEVETDGCTSSSTTKSCLAMHRSKLYNPNRNHGVSSFRGGSNFLKLSKGQYISFGHQTIDSSTHFPFAILFDYDAKRLQLMSLKHRPFKTGIFDPTSIWLAGDQILIGTVHTKGAWRPLYKALNPRAPLDCKDCAFDNSVYAVSLGAGQLKAALDGVSHVAGQETEAKVASSILQEARQWLSAPLVLAFICDQHGVRSHDSPTRVLQGKSLPSNQALVMSQLPADPAATHLCVQIHESTYLSNHTVAYVNMSHNYNYTYVMTASTHISSELAIKARPKAVISTGPPWGPYPNYGSSIRASRKRFLSVMQTICNSAKVCVEQRHLFAVQVIHNAAGEV